nr:FAD-binding oxidoreductase [Sulfurimonas sp. MAG313]
MDESESIKAYDIAIIGAGINGCALAYELHKSGQKVIVMDKEGIASGGSGAAGAFINPKISKAGELKKLIEEAYRYSLDFYNENFPKFTTQAPLLHISKYENDNEKVQYFKDSTSLALQEPPTSLLNKLKPHALAYSSVCLKNNAIVEAKEICEAMLTGVDYKKIHLKKPKFINGFWEIDGYKAKKIVLCTGAYEEVFKEDYISLRRIYGQRCEIESSSFMHESVHHEVSISATKKNGCIAIGASHYLDEKDLPSKKQGAQDLILLAQKSIELKDIKIINTFTGMRSGSNDYLPIVGSLIDMQKSLELGPSALKGDKTAFLSFIPNVYMINGVGGYGFVLAPFLAKMMKEFLVEGKALASYLEPKRFYYRYAKKKGSL